MMQQQIIVQHLIDNHERERVAWTEELNQARAKVAELAVSLNEARAEIARLKRGSAAENEYEAALAEMDLP